MSINFDHIVQTRTKIAETAQTMLDDKLSYIEGCRLICDLLRPARLERLEAPFVVFVAVESETDTVPMGEVRERWHPEAKVRLAQDWENAEQYAKTYCEAACRDAIAWIIEHPFKFD
jgi:hypothetical protein